MHPNDICPFSKKAFIINPYKGKKITLGKPHIFQNEKYFSLNSVSKALTVNDNMGVELGLNNTGGMFHACSTGNSSMTGLGDEFTFSYPKLFFMLQDNTFFETQNGGIQLLCHTKKAEEDDIDCYAYISLQTVGTYMTKDGYFIDFKDDGTGVWYFELSSDVRKPEVSIITPRQGDSFNIGDILTVKATVNNAAYAKLTVREYAELRDNPENQDTVIFSDYIFTNDDVGDVSLKVEAGSAISSNTVTSTVQIRIEEPGKSYVTASQLQAFGWENTSDQEVAALNATLEKYGITSMDSIVLFLATCGHESGKGAIPLEKLNNDGTTVGNYDKNERGAGYIQITRRDTHLKFLKTVNDSYNEADTATYIAKNYPWEAAGWFWSSTDAKTAGGLSLNEYAAKYGDAKGVFLTTQYLVNGWPSGLTNDTAIDIRDGKVSWEIENGRLLVDSKDICRVPIGWEDREINYNDALKYFK